MNTNIPLVDFIQQRDFKQNRFLQCLLIVFILFSAAMAISPYDRTDWLIDNLLTFIFFILILVTYKHIKFSNISYCLITIFMMLHVYGAHYSYITPLSGWLEYLSGLDRDNYDRVVHFCFGLFIGYPCFEFMRKYVKVSKPWAYLLTVMVILAMGAFYELIEMWVAQIVAPKLGALFLGTQGDSWDAQHDMAVAMYGAALAMIITALVSKKASK